MEQLAEAAPQITLEPAGFWLRGGALVIDNLILSVVTLTLAGIFRLVGLPGLLAAILNVAIPASYFTWMPAAKDGQTLGKRFAGLSIVTKDGGPVTYAQGFRRWLGYMLSAFTLGIGYFIALFTENKRALQDMVAGTRVVAVHPISGGRKFVVVGCAVLMPLVAALGIVAALAIPKFAAMQNAAGEAMAKANLGVLRSAAAVYLADNKANPKDLSALTPKYVAGIPEIEVGGHPKTSAVTAYGAEACDGRNVKGDALKDTGGWGYVSAPGASCDGSVFIDAKQQDAAGKDWFSN